MRRRAQMASRFWHGFGCQLRNPTGRAGRWIGSLMSLINRQPNLLAIEALQVSQSSSVLELGIGSGWAVERLARLAAHGRIWGIDQSADMLTAASRRIGAAAQRERISLARARFGSLPFPSASFDRVLAVNVAYFFDSDGRDLREARRVLRPGGRMVIYISDRATLANWPFAREDTHRSYDADELVKAIKHGGFAAEEIEMVAVGLPLGVSGLLATMVKQA